MSSRFYTLDGQVIEGLRNARKLDPLPLPSVSTVLGIISSYSLTQYFRRQMHKATTELARLPEEDEDAYYQRCVARSDEHGRIARDKGSNFHDAVQQFHLAMKYGKPIPNPPSELTTQYGMYVDWYNKNVAETLMVEDVINGKGYSGRVDHVCRLISGRKAVTDCKTQDKKDRKSFNQYGSWSYQLGAYSQPIEGDTLISVVVSSNGEPVLEAYEWPRIPGFYYDMFMGLLEVWRHENDYY